MSDYITTKTVDDKIKIFLGGTQLKRRAIDSLPLRDCYTDYHNDVDIIGKVSRGTHGKHILIAEDESGFAVRYELDPYFNMVPPRAPHKPYFTGYKPSEPYLRTVKQQSDTAVLFLTLDESEEFLPCVAQEIIRSGFQNMFFRAGDIVDRISEPDPFNKEMFPLLMVINGGINRLEIRSLYPSGIIKDVENDGSFTIKSYVELRSLTEEYFESSHALRLRFLPILRELDDKLVARVEEDNRTLMQTYQSRLAEYEIAAAKHELALKEFDEESQMAEYKRLMEEYENSKEMYYDLVEAFESHPVIKF